MTISFDIEKIQKYLPHRYPFLLLDRVLEFEAHKKIKVLKNVTANEYFFPGHFPRQMVMPGVLTIEVMAQAFGLFVIASYEEEGLDTVFLVGVDKCRFRSQIKPGDQMIIEVLSFKKKMSIWIGNVTVKVDNRIVAEALLHAFVDSSSAMAIER